MTSDHKEHLIRTAIVVVLFLSTGAAWLFGDLDASAKTTVELFLIPLGLGVLDTLRLARNQRTQRRDENKP